MIRKNQKIVDVDAIIKLFGGKHQIVADYEKYLRTIITVKAIEKWGEREAIAFKHILNLTTIAERRGMEFKIAEYVS